MVAVLSTTAEGWISTANRHRMCKHL
jgi:hypothetical protein